MITNSAKWSHPPGNPVVPSPWQATAHRLLTGTASWRHLTTVTYGRRQGGADHHGSKTQAGRLVRHRRRSDGIRRMTGATTCLGVATFAAP